eukprot:COSAG02_NODE_403_length_23058_cov_12.124134_14_plen_82_part_00
MPPVLPPPPTAAAAPAYRPRPRTPPNCKDPELQALAPPRSPAAPPFPTSSTPSPVAFFNIRARVQNRACKVVRGRMGDLRY